MLYAQLPKSPSVVSKETEAALKGKLSRVSLIQLL